MHKRTGYHKKTANKKKMSSTLLADAELTLTFCSCGRRLQPSTSRIPLKEAMDENKNSAINIYFDPLSKQQTNITIKKCSLCGGRFCSYCCSFTLSNNNGACLSCVEELLKRNEYNSSAGAEVKNSIGCVASFSSVPTVHSNTTMPSASSAASITHIPTSVAASVATSPSIVPKKTCTINAPSITTPVSTSSPATSLRKPPSAASHTAAPAVRVSRPSSNRLSYVLSLLIVIFGAVILAYITPSSTSLPTALPTSTPISPHASPASVFPTISTSKPKPPRLLLNIVSPSSSYPTLQTITATMRRSISSATTKAARAAKIGVEKAKSKVREAINRRRKNRSR